MQDTIIKGIEDLAEKFGVLAQKLHVRCATAESCTAGAIAYAITEVPGASQWFDRGFVTYSNQSKMEMLQVQPQTIKQYGAVSEQTVIEMVQGALKYSDATVAVAVSGIAGPDGAMPGKPVGTVWFGFAKKTDDSMCIQSKVCHFSGTRKDVRLATVEYALCGLISMLEDH